MADAFYRNFEAAFQKLTFFQVILISPKFRELE